MPLANILERRRAKFVLWSPRPQPTPPVLVIGELRPGNPPSLLNVRRLPMAAAPDVPQGLFELAASACGLTSGTVYHYWLEVDDSRSTSQPPPRVAVTDPFTSCVDWRAFAPANAGGKVDFSQPAAVTKFVAPDRLVDCDPGGEEAAFPGPDTPQARARNNQLVIYELPTAWTLSRAFSAPERGAATFLDVAALADENLGGENFAELQVLSQGTSYLQDLGVNAVELLPLADSRYNREWGYGTSHYLAPDHELGFPEGNSSPTPNRSTTPTFSGPTLETASGCWLGGAARRRSGQSSCSPISQISHQRRAPTIAFQPGPARLPARNGSTFLKVIARFPCPARSQSSRGRQRSIRWSIFEAARRSSVISRRGSRRLR